MLSQNLKQKIRSIIQDRIALTDKNWKRATKFFPFVDGMFKYVTTPILGPMIKKMGALENFENQYSQGYIMTLNRDLNYKKQSKNVVLPINLVKKAIKESSYRVIVNYCFCRDGNNCQNFPADFGCIMLGEGTRVIVKRGFAREATVKEALDHLDKAAEMGLVALCLWMELEAFGMGISKEDHHRLLEICLCCPCCCLGLRNFKKMGPDVGRRFNSIGWKAASGEGCVGCAICASICPVGAITVGADSITVSDACIGCGLCAARCPQEAIVMEQIAPMKKSILDYFWGFRPQIQA